MNWGSTPTPATPTLLQAQNSLVSINPSNHKLTMVYLWGIDWIEQCFTSPSTQYRLYGRRFLQAKRPNQQY